MTPRGSGPAFALAVVFDAYGDPAPLARAQRAIAALPDDDELRRNDAAILTHWRYDSRAFLRAFGGCVSDHLLARLARAGALSSELLALSDEARRLAA